MPHAFHSLGTTSKRSPSTTASRCLPSVWASSRLPPEETRDAVRAALGGGYRLIDTAAACRNERQVGERPESDAITLEAFGREIPDG